MDFPTQPSMSKFDFVIKSETDISISSGLKSANSQKYKHTYFTAERIQESDIL